MNDRRGMLSGSGMISCRWICLILLLLAGSGCSDSNDVPSGILSRDKMEAVLWDMAQADQYAALYLTKDSAHIDRKTETLRLYEQVFRLHQVTREEFRKSYRYYLEHPKLNQLLFDSVIARGSRARTEDYDRPFAPHPPTVAAAGLSPAGAAGSARAVPGGPAKISPGAAAAFSPSFIRARDSAFKVREAVRYRDSVFRVRQALRSKDSAFRTGHPATKKDTIKKRS